MVRRKLDQRGVSLVEVILTLAISALLLTTILSGRNSIRSTAQFSDGMERIKETVLTVKSDANNSVNNKGSGIGTGISTQRYLVLGRTIQFIKNSNKVQTAAILCYADADDVCQETIRINEVKSVTLPWGITYTGGYSSGSASTTSNDLTVVFWRDQDTGLFSGWWYPGVVQNDAKFASYESNASTSPVTLNFKSPDGRTATVTVNPVTGAVVRDIP